MPQRYCIALLVLLVLFATPAISRSQGTLRATELKPVQWISNSPTVPVDICGDSDPYFPPSAHFWVGFCENPLVGDYEKWDGRVDFIWGDDGSVIGATEYRAWVMWDITPFHDRFVQRGPFTVYDLVVRIDMRDNNTSSGHVTQYRELQINPLNESCSDMWDELGNGPVYGQFTTVTGRNFVFLNNDAKRDFEMYSMTQIWFGIAITEDNDNEGWAHASGYDAANPPELTVIWEDCAPVKTDTWGAIKALYP